MRAESDGAILSLSSLTSLSQDLTTLLLASEGTSARLRTSTQVAMFCANSRHIFVEQKQQTFGSSVRQTYLGMLSSGQARAVNW